MNYLLKSLLSLALLLTSFLNSNENAVNVIDGKFSEIHMIFDKNKKRHDEFKIYLPKHFTLAYRNRTNNQITLEFIPEGEKISNWSEIITIIFADGIAKSEEALAAYLEGHQLIFLSALKPEEVQQAGYHTYKEGDCPAATFVADAAATRVGAKLYHKNRRIPGKNEIVMIKTILGERLMQYQYAIQYDENISDEQKQILIQKMEEILSHCTVISAVKVS